MELGAEFVDLSEEVSNDLNVRGVQVKRLKDGLLADQTRIRPGFIITKVDGRSVSNTSELQRRLAAAKSGSVGIEGVYPDSPDRVVPYAIYKMDN